jgi:hypothetical protein
VFSSQQAPLWPSAEDVQKLEQQLGLMPSPGHESGAGVLIVPGLVVSDAAELEARVEAFFAKQHQSVNANDHQSVNHGHDHGHDDHDDHDYDHGILLSSAPVFLPYVHFIPLRADLVDLPGKLDFVLRHDAWAQRIAEAGAHLAKEVYSKFQNERNDSKYILK